MAEAGGAEAGGTRAGGTRAGSTQAGSRPVTAFADTALTRPLWPHQERALGALRPDRRRAEPAATYLVVPPGGGKTLIGLEAVRRIGRPAIVLCPNTAIQAQWVAQWQAAFAPASGAASTPATMSRELPTPLTVLTYQAVCTLEPGHSTPGHMVERRSRGGAPVSWQRFARDEPALADAAIRLHTAGLLPLPDGARVTEQHRHPPTAEDWVALIGDYCQRCLLASGDEQDERAYEAIRRVLPSVGYRLTRAGVRAGNSPVDRVLARSASKAYAAIEILAAESAELGPRLRALVLCDHEEASGTLPADLAGTVLTAEAGGGQLVLETLLADPQAKELDPVLMTGRGVACGADTADRLADWLRAADPRLHNDVTVGPLGRWAHARDVSAAGGWDPRRFVPLVTRFYAEGGTRCLIGTRALLGEGWDAPAVNVVVDLTVATTATSVVQARGRALRLDGGWPAKVADNWGVVCIADDHPKGSADFGRFVRKHDHYFALAATGDIVSGVAHVDPRLSPYGPPAADRFGALNAEMLQRPAGREAARQLWAIGTPYQDEPVATVTIARRAPLGLSGQALRLPDAAHPARPGRRAAWAGAALAVVALAGIALPAAAVVVAGLLLLAGLAALRAAAARVTAAGSDGSLEDIAAAIADALHGAGLTGRSADAVLVEAQADGTYRARLRDVPAGESAQFTQALEESLAPLAQPRYVISRLIIAPPRGRGGATGLALRRLVTGRVPAAVIYHAVPGALSSNKKLATIFERSWNARVSPGEVLFTGSPEGAGVLAAQRGDDPFALTTQIRTLWR